MPLLCHCTALEHSCKSNISYRYLVKTEWTGLMRQEHCFLTKHAGTIDTLLNKGAQDNGQVSRGANSILTYICMCFSEDCILKIKPRTSQILAKCSTNKPYTCPSLLLPLLSCLF